MYNFSIFVEDLLVHSEIKSNQINTNTMKIKHLFLSVLAMASVAVACNKNEDPSSDKPSLTLNPTELTFEIAGGTKTVAVEANREWSIADGDKNAWVKAEKTSDNQITVTVEANTSFDRSAEFTVRMVGTKKTLTVAQKGSGSQSDAYVYHNNFDKADAVKASSGWPYLDKTDVWKNEEGSGVSTVAYASSSASVRQSGKLSDAEGFTDYAGSGRNKIFFGANSNFQIQNITLPSSTNFELTFGGNKYGQSEASNVFNHDEFKVYVSNDGSKYVELAYTFANGDPDGKWSLASSKFTVPAGTTALYIYFQCTKASVYSIDDVTLLTSTTAGTAIDFSKGVELGGGTTPTPGPGPTPEGAIFSETFSASQGNFTIDDKSLAEGLTYIWKHDAQYHYMKASAFVGGKSYASESWLVSPEIDLSSEKAAFLSFMHTANKFPAGKTAKDFVSVKISKDGTTWDNLTVPTWPAGTDWIFVSSGSIDLKAYLGSKVKIAFVYTSKDGESGSWEINNVLVKAEGTTEPVGPTPEPEPSEPTTVTWDVSKGTNAYDADVIEGAKKYKGFKLGTSKNAGSLDITIVAGVSKVTFNAAAYKGKTASLSFSLGETEIKKIELKELVSISGNPPFTMSEADIAAKQSFTINIAELNGGKPLEKAMTVKATSVKGTDSRAVVWNIVTE